MRVAGRSLRSSSLGRANLSRWAGGDCYIDAGFTEVALVQIGAEHQDAFVRWAQDELLPALRSIDAG